MNEKILSRLAIISAILAVSLSLSRAVSVLSFSEPIHNVTSGWEQETLFALWKWINDLPVYNDPRNCRFQSHFIIGFSTIFMAR